MGYIDPACKADDMVLIEIASDGSQNPCTHDIYPFLFLDERCLRSYIVHLFPVVGAYGLCLFGFSQNLGDQTKSADHGIRAFHDYAECCDTCLFKVFHQGPG